MATLYDVIPLVRAAARFVPPDHPHIGSEHVALLALDGPDGILTLTRRAGDTTVHDALVACCTDTIVRPPTSEPAITVRTASLFALAAQLAAADEAEGIRPVHLALALIAYPGAMAWRGLLAAGVLPAMLIAGARNAGASRAVALLAATPGLHYAYREVLNDSLSGWCGFGQIRREDPASWTEEDERSRVAYRERYAVFLAVARELGWVPPSCFAAVEADDAELAANEIRLALAPLAPRPN